MKTTHIHIDKTATPNIIYINGVVQEDKCDIKLENLSVFICGKKIGEILKLENFVYKIEIWVKE